MRDSKIPPSPPGDASCALVGLGLRGAFLDEMLRRRPPLGWLEVHSENFFGDGRLRRGLIDLRADYPVALHGVAMGLLSPDPLDGEHLRHLKALVDDIEPFLVSEHLCWNRVEGRFFHDLLPHPFTDDFLNRAVERVDAVQSALGRAIAVEPITRYVAFTDDAMAEADFLSALVARTGCGLLLDLENALLNQHNLGLNAQDFVRALPKAAIWEYHLAGHIAGDGIINDSHAAPVDAALWDFYRWTLANIGPRPTLLERDNRIPPLDDLLAECAVMAACLEDAAVAA